MLEYIKYGNLPNQYNWIYQTSITDSLGVLLSGESYTTGILCVNSPDKEKKRFLTKKDSKKGQTHGQHIKKLKK